MRDSCCQSVNSPSDDEVVLDVRKVTDPLDNVTGMALLAGGANVIMQLARKPVGYGVMKSPVEEGNLYTHPIRRTRTTLTYLMAALYATPEEARELRKQIDRMHAQVCSAPDAEVQYNAFDRTLQMWVAACLYRGAEDSFRALVGEMDEQTTETFYQHGKRFGTTLQVPEEMWPADRAAFDKYWAEEVQLIDIDDETREYLNEIPRLKFYGKVVSFLLGRFGEFVTTGFLPPEFRAQMHLKWDERRQRRFDRLLAVLRGVNRVLPRFVREFPLNVVWWDARRRMRRGKPVI